MVADKDGSKRFSKPNQEGSKRKILERLASDARKLANLQITAKDLKRKVDITETGEKGEGIEYGIVKKQLEEDEEALVKLGDANRKLMTQVEDGSWYPDGKYALESDESGSKIQFLVLQLDDGKNSTERKTRVQLRDYIYGGRNVPKKKKSHFCP
ncbi:hypothetical protein F3Y22_tig00111101pilonHSYRG00003 [Hibiscus syriacus]|uniref:Uncharacterized protein n=1 Tax=Hibiscus syriacus TaxID=106335 RepID=A0A6A2Z092_HIBSY|nr:hypothetical protein F3Y22_tig00111101pilonHSYRG00003 [Hibiscus syriacus]